ncbi:MAG: hypothetical protein JWQ35_652 [Bacteriovoracaceae bacterium]|nr:hypothetical protein [Bacteriovoracaceae bacterium]
MLRGILSFSFLFYLGAASLCVHGEKTSSRSKKCLSSIARISEQSFTEELKSLDPARGIHFSVLKTSKFFPKSAMAELHKIFPANKKSLSLLVFDEGLGNEVQSKLSLLSRFVKTFVSSLNESLAPAERVEIREAEIRKWTKKQSDENISAAVWHQDLDYLNVTLTLLGEGTTYSDKNGIHQVPTGDLFIFSGVDREFRFKSVKAINHVSPANLKQDRLVVVLSLKQIVRISTKSTAL